MIKKMEKNEGDRMREREREREWMLGVRERERDKGRLSVILVFDDCFLGRRFKGISKI